MHPTAPFEQSFRPLLRSNDFPLSHFRFTIELFICYQSTPKMTKVGRKRTRGSKTMSSAGLRCNLKESSTASRSQHKLRSGSTLAESDGSEQSRKTKPSARSRRRKSPMENNGVSIEPGLDSEEELDPFSSRVKWSKKKIGVSKRLLCLRGFSV